MNRFSSTDPDANVYANLRRGSIYKPYVALH